MSDALHVLTGNDIALAEFGLMHMLAWWKEQPKSTFQKREIQKAEDLLQRLSAISSYAYPYDHHREMELDVGGEPIMAMCGKTVLGTRRAALGE